MHVFRRLKSDTLPWKVIEKEGRYNTEMNYLQIYFFLAPRMVTYERAA